MNFNPSNADELVNLPLMAQKIGLPGIGGNDDFLTCYTDDDGTTKCFHSSGQNEISCKGNECFVNYKTLSQNLLGSTKRIKKLDLDVLMIPSGLSTSIMLVGTIPRKNMKTLNKIIGKVSTREVDELPRLTIGVPVPPENCNLNPFGKGCSYYLSSDDYMFIPLIGFKRKVDVMMNPKTILKSEIMPSVKKIARKFFESLKTRKSKNDGNVTINENPMHVQHTKVLGSGGIDPVKSNDI